YSIIGGADQSKFSVDASTGVLSWSNFTPNANAPADANTDNIYEVRVKVTDSNGLTGVQTMRISVSTQSVTTSSLNCPNNQSVVTSRDGVGNCTAVIDWTEAETSSLCAQSLLTYAFTGATAGTGSGLIPGTQTFEKGSTTVTYTLPGQTPTTCSFTVTVTDDEAPTITCPGASSNGLSGGSCSMAVSGLNATYSDNCTGSTLAYALSGATTATGSGQATGSTFQAGTTTVTYTVTDAVGNTATCSGTVTVTVLPATVGTTDNSGAQMNDGIVCSGLKATLTSVSTGTAYAWSNGATTQSVTITPAGAETYTVTVTLGAGCTTSGQASVNLHSTATMNAVPDYGPLCHNDNLSVTFGSNLSGVTYAWRNNNPNVGTLAGNGGSISMQVKNTTAVSQTGQFVVTPTYQGCTGRKDTFLVRVNCATMSGGVLWHETGAAVSGVTMTMTGDASDTRTTGSNGRYGFNQKNGGTFTIRPTRNQSFASTAELNAFGVNAADLAAIQAHLNGSASLTGMRLISADINVTNSVNATDVSIMSAALGGNASARSFFNTNTWRFCDSVHVFLNPSSPWGWPQAKTYNSVNGVFNRTSFRATKKGDVSQSNSRPDSDPVSLMIPGGELPFDQESEVVLSLSGLRDMRALQAALQFDP
ncbi:MAG: HYR domain-containing protein, partial [Bacteroidota bacterium]